MTLMLASVTDASEAELAVSGGADVIDFEDPPINASMGETRADDMRAVFSYEVILDAIRLVVGRGHVNFIETMVEDVAEIVLRHPCVLMVKVRAEQLDIIEGAAGVKIVRE
jgi:(5-formylfuran-3-yl)methyl phosphate synthase